jgi:hypothetical protein
MTERYLVKNGNETILNTLRSEASVPPDKLQELLNSWKKDRTIFSDDNDGLNILFESEKEDRKTPPPLFNVTANDACTTYIEANLNG